MPDANHPQEVIVIERIAPGGDGLGRLSNGQWVFVSGTAPGDHVEIAALTRRKGVARGAILRLVRAGADRVEPRCPIASSCGGCDLMHVSLQGQRTIKFGMLEDALLRIGGVTFEWANVRYVTEGDGFAYRSRLRLHVDENGKLGFLSARSKTVVPVQQCPVAEPLLNEVLARLGAADADCTRLLKLCDQLELRAAVFEPKLAVRLFAKPGLNLHLPSFQRLFPEGTVVVIAGGPQDDAKFQRCELPGGVTICVPTSAFSQVNRSINALLVRDVVHSATLRGLRSFVDAYAGAGNFTLPLLAAGLVGESIDSAPSGIVAARGVARDRGLPFIGFNVGDARGQFEILVRNRRQFDLVLLDPPRAGAKDVLPLALRLQPQLIAIIACDPVSLARDLKSLLAAGAKLEALTVYDMFPQTHHIETLALVAI